MLSCLKQIIERFLIAFRRYKCYAFYVSQFKRYLKAQGIENKKAEGEDDYIAKWKVLCKIVEPFSYRFFSHYCGNTPNIIPEDIGHSYVESILNPPTFRPVYSDKNLFPKIIGKEHLPRTILCRINGSGLLDADFHYADKSLAHYIGNLDRLVLKPSKGRSGKGVMLFHKDGEKFVSNDNNIVLSKDFLLSCGRDFCLQEAVQQHAFMSNLCSSSVNTIRLCLYRSVKDEESHVTASIIRIGKEGAFVDNAHAGGTFVGVDLSTGMLGKYVMDQYGNKKTIWNQIDFSTITLYVPFWHDVISFARFVGTRIPHHRLIALDVALESSGNPILIEYNIDSFGYWLFMLTGQEVFGGYTDEIIDYCVKRKK